jgi:uncharacterized protein with PIN domain
MKFVADSMLGKLARWLRILGYDTAYDPYGEDNALIRQAQAEGRILLTRDRPLSERMPNGRCLLVAAGDLDGQVAQLVAEIDLDLDRRTFTRCLICNEPLVALSRPKAEGRVPPYVYKTQTRFQLCPACDRVYWRGTHLDRMSERLERIRMVAGRQRSSARDGAP